MMNDDDRDNDDDRHDDDDVYNEYFCPFVYICVQYYQSGRYLPLRIDRYLIHEEHLSDFPVTDCNMVCLLLPLAAYSATG